MAIVEQLEKARRAGQEAERIQAEALQQQQQAAATQEQARADAERARAEQERAERQLSAWNRETLAMHRDIEGELAKLLTSRKPLGYLPRDARVSARMWLVGALDDTSATSGEMFNLLFAKIPDPWLYAVKALRDRLGVINNREGSQALAQQLDVTECRTWAAIVSRIREAAGEEV